jgi:hypothetical protein
MDEESLKEWGKANEARSNKQEVALRRNCGKPIVDRAYAATPLVSARSSRF